MATTFTSRGTYMVFGQQAFCIVFYGRCYAGIARLASDRNRSGGGVSTQKLPRLHTFRKSHITVGVAELHNTLGNKSLISTSADREVAISGETLQTLAPGPASIAWRYPVLMERFKA